MSLLVRTNRTKLQKALGTGHGVVELAEVSDVASGGVLQVGAPDDVGPLASGVWTEPEAADSANHVSMLVTVEDEAGGGGSAAVRLVVDDEEDEGAPPVDMLGGSVGASGVIMGSLQAVVPEGAAYYLDVEGDLVVTVESVVEQALG